jgi:hypothetical protein
VRFLSHAGGKIFIMREGRLKAKKGAGHETLGSIAMHVSKNTWQTKAKSKKNSAAQGTPLLVLLRA